MQDRTKKQMSAQLNVLVGLSVDWSALKRSDLEQICRFFEDLTVPRAVNLSTTTFHLRLEQIPLVKVLRERAEIVRQDYQKQTLFQLKLKKNPAGLGRGSVQPQSPDRKRHSYIS